MPTAKQKLTTIDSKEFQILPSQGAETFQLRTVRKSRAPVYSLLILIGVGLIFGGLRYWRSVLLEEVAAIDAELIQIDTTRNKSLEKELLVFQKRIELTQAVIRNHVRMSAFVNHIEKIVKPDSVLNGLRVDGSRNLAAFEVTVPDFNKAAQQIAAFQSYNQVKKVTIGSMAETSDQSVRFTVEIEFLPSAFK